MSKSPNKYSRALLKYTFLANSILCAYKSAVALDIPEVSIDTAHLIRTLMILGATVNLAVFAILDALRPHGSD